MTAVARMRPALLASATAIALLASGCSQITRDPAPGASNSPTPAISSIQPTGVGSQPGQSGTRTPPDSATETSTRTAIGQPGVGITASILAPDWVAIAAFAEPSTASIQVVSASTSAAGSGIVMDSDGNILTNHHVVASLGRDVRILVTLSDSLTYPATIVGSDAMTDIAVVRLTDPPSLMPATWGNSDEVEVGDPVMAIGDPLGLQSTVTTGIVSALHRPVLTQQATTEDDEAPLNPFDPRQRGQQASVTSFSSALQTDAAVNPGNSGGALVDANGRVVGVNSAIASNSASSGTAGSIGLGFAIPINTALTIADQLVRTGTARHAALGVTAISGQANVGNAIAAGAEVVRVFSGSAAEQAELRSGDLIVAVNGVSTGTATALTAYIRSLAIGSRHELTVLRGGSSQTITVTLGAGE